MNKKSSLALTALVIGLVATAASARAQSFRLNTFRAVERPDDGFGVRRLGAFGHLRLGGVLTADYANDPLVLEREGGSDVLTVVDHTLTLKLDFSLSLWDRVIVFAGFDAAPVLHGPDIPLALMAPVPEADGPGFGDVSTGARLRLVGDADDLFGLGVQAAVIIPTAGEQAYRGEDKTAVRSDVIAEFRPRVLRISLNVGALVRAKQQLLDATVDDALVYGLGLALPLRERLELIGELYGSFALHDFGGRNSSDVEWLIGPKFTFLKGFILGGGFGTGLSGGLGAPDARVVAQVGYLTPLPQREVPPPLPPLPPPPPDPDGDGVLAQRDLCPDIAEDADGFEDADGCPEPDNDRDGLLDIADACRDAAEDPDGFEDGDGCPDPDNDRDGIVDGEDRCPDKKGVLEEHGCPARVTLQESGEMQILDQILFANNQATILEESFPILEAVQRVFADHPQIVKVRIEGHTDSVGADFKNFQLSQARAKAVAAWLIAHGVEAKRLVAFGCGEKHPLVAESTDADRQQNRRVVFQVIDPAPPDVKVVKAPAGCRAIPIK